MLYAIARIENLQRRRALTRDRIMDPIVAALLGCAGAVTMWLVPVDRVEPNADDRWNPNATATVSSPTPSGSPRRPSAAPTEGTGLNPTEPNLMGVVPIGELTINSDLTKVSNRTSVKGRSSKLSDGETIWLLVQEVGASTVFTAGFCHFSDPMWICDAVPFGEAGVGVGQKYWVTAVVIHDGSEEEEYEKAKVSGYPHNNPPVKPTRVSETITVTRT
ncbi:hypothetical protein WEI85_25670 [Actinomycetes bacterium KLBMP 9797]